jgi:hypothetical protein
MMVKALVKLHIEREGEREKMEKDYLRFSA